MKKIGFKFLVAVLCVVIGVASVAMAEEHTHVYGEWNVRDAATCVAEGVKVRMCPECGDVESEAIPKAAHSYGEWNVKDAATCVAEGVKVRMCPECGDVDSETIPANGHIWTDIPAKEPTYTEAGNTAGKKCEVCGLTEGAETIPALEPTDAPTTEPTSAPTAQPTAKPTKAPAADDDDVPKTGVNYAGYIIASAGMMLALVYLVLRRVIRSK